MIGRIVATLLVAAAPTSCGTLFPVNRAGDFSARGTAATDRVGVYFDENIQIFGIDGEQVQIRTWAVGQTTLITLNPGDHELKLKSVKGSGSSSNGYMTTLSSIQSGTIPFLTSLESGKADLSVAKLLVTPFDSSLKSLSQRSP